MLNLQSILKAVINICMFILLLMAVVTMGSELLVHSGSKYAIIGLVIGSFFAFYGVVLFWVGKVQKVLQTKAREIGDAGLTAAVQKLSILLIATLLPMIILLGTLLIGMISRLASGTPLLG